MTGKRLYFSVTALLLTLATFLAVSTGRYPIDLPTLAKIVISFFRTDDTAEALNNPALVLWSIRVPRIAMSMLTGAALSVSGVIFQGLFRNPLVSPTILGVTSGANFGAALVLLYGGGSVALLETSSFVWGAIAVWITWQIGKKGDNSATTLVLAGVIVSSLFVAGLSYLKCKADPLGQLPAIVFWTMGSFNSVSWSDTTAGGAVIAAGLIAAYLFRWGLNPMALGDEEALSLGVDVFRRRSGYIFIATVMVSAATASCGTIGWTGLVIPHAGRMIIGADHDQLIPFSAMLGAIFMLCMDTLARVLPGGEVPVGILTAIVGAPFFGYLLVKKRQNDWNG